MKQTAKDFLLNRATIFNDENGIPMVSAELAIKLMKEYATQSNQANGGEGIRDEFTKTIKDILDISDSSPLGKFGNDTIAEQIYFSTKKYFTPSIVSSKGFSVEDVIKAMDFAHNEGLLYANNPTYKSPLQDYKDWIKKNLPSQSPDKKDLLPEGLLDWNMLSIDQMVEYLRKKYMFSSSGDAKCIYHLIEFYDKYKSTQSIDKESEAATGVNGGEIWEDVISKTGFMSEYVDRLHLISFLKEHYNPPTIK